jgi:hypothetical protein
MLWSGTQRLSFRHCLRGLSILKTRGQLFSAWEYRPAYFSDPFFMYIGEA